MNLKTIHLTNFRCFEKFTIDFNEGINVIVGENGIGKTAILDGIAKGIGGSPFYSVEKKISKLEQDLNKLNSGDHRIGDYLNNNETKIEIDLHNKSQNKRFLATRKKTKLKSAVQEFDFSVLYPEFTSKSKATRENRDVGLPILKYYSTARLVHSKGYRKPVDREYYFGDRLSAYNNCMQVNPKYDFIDYWLLGSGKKYLERYGGDRIDFLLNTLSTLIPGIEKVFFADGGDDIFYSFKQGINPLPLKFLSDGQKVLIKVLGDLLFRCVVLNYSSYHEKTFQLTEGIVLIDEIDLHLHPKWQREIIDNLRKVFPKIQFIISTHSPFVLQSLKKGEIRYIDDNKKRFDAYEGLGIEEIAEEVQGITMPHLSHRKQTMFETAEKVFMELKTKSNTLSRNDKLKLQEQLIEKIAPYSDDVAYSAFMKIQILDLKEK
jgi:predicted ATP-binding protein involved in virulence